MNQVIPTNVIYNEDTWETMSNLSSESVSLIICDGPYGITDLAWDRVGNIQEYNLELIKQFSRLLKPGGSAYLFGKHDCIDFIDYRPYLKLNNRIIWYQPSRLAQGKKRYTKNYDVILHFSKGNASTFNLDDIRVPQLVELTQRKRCENVPSVKNGKFSKTRFNQKGKNPGDVWGDIKQLTYRSKELLNRKYLNTIQKPEKLMERIVLASSNPGEIVFDPFSGTGTVSKVAKFNGRLFIGVEKDIDLWKLSMERVFGNRWDNTQGQKLAYATEKEKEKTQTKFIQNNIRAVRAALPS